MKKGKNNFNTLVKELNNTKLERQKALKELECDREKSIFLSIKLWRVYVRHVQAKKRLFSLGLLGLDYSKQILIANHINEVEEFISSYLKLTPAEKVDVRINQICFESKLHAYIEELNTLL